MIKLLQGDCLDLLRSVPDKSVDLVVTDPPYIFETRGSGFHKKVDYYDEIRNVGLADGFSVEILDELCRVMKAINIYVWCNKAQIRLYLDYFEDLGCHMDLITWHKTNPVPTCNNKYLSDTEYCLFFRSKGVRVHGNYDSLFKYYVTPLNQADKKKYGHPTIKPLNIIENLIVNSSNEGDTVLDCFMGSGTTGVACRKLNRDFIGMEINPEYFAIAEKRIYGIDEQMEMDI